MTLSPEPAAAKTLPASDIERGDAVPSDAVPNDAVPTDAVAPCATAPNAAEPSAAEPDAAGRSHAEPSGAPQLEGGASEAAGGDPLATQLICGAAMETPEVLEVGGGSVCYYSRRCDGKPTANEDAAAVIPVADRGVVIAVADGVGGLPQGDKAARITLETLIEHLAGISDPAALRSTILDAIERANRRVLALGGGAATTLAVAQIVDGRARTYHVGDSEVLIIGARGAVKSQTIAHAPVAYGVHSGWIDAVDALVHEQRNLVSNVVGSTEMRIEIGPPIRLAQRDIVLVCSDGITDNLHAEEIGTEICARTAEGAVRAVLESLNRRREMEAGELYKEDDATLVTFRRTASSSKAVTMPNTAVEMPAHQL